MAPRKKKSKKKVSIDFNLLVINPEELGGIEEVKLEFKYKQEFISRFGTLVAPTSAEFKEWINEINNK